MQRRRLFLPRGRKPRPSRAISSSCKAKVQDLRGGKVRRGRWQGLRWFMPASTWRSRRALQPALQLTRSVQLARHLDLHSEPCHEISWISRAASCPVVTYIKRNAFELKHLSTACISRWCEISRASLKCTCHCVPYFCGTMAPGTKEDLAALDGPDDWVSLFLNEVDGQPPDYMVGVMFVIVSAIQPVSSLNEVHRNFRLSQDLFLSPC